MKLENTKKSAKFTTLDSTIVHEDPNGGEPKAVTMKINECNQEMSRMMGVSHAVLNNVIFCHQEDSNWPLDEGKKLKEKFDAIFGTTEYNKAIKKLGEVVRDNEARLKLAKKDLEVKDKELKDQEKKTRLLSNDIEQRESLCTEIENVQLVRQEAQEKYKQLAKKERLLNELEAERKQFENSIKLLNEQIIKIQSKIKEMLDEDEDSIQEKLQKFTEILEIKENEKQNLSDEVQKIELRINIISNEINEKKTNIELMATKIGEMQEKIDERAKEMINLASKMNLELSIDIETQSLDESGLMLAFEEIETSIKNQKKLLNKSKHEGQKTELEMQKKIDEKREEKTEISTNIKSFSKRVLEIGKERSELKTQISTIEKSIPSLNKLEKDIKITQKDLDDIKNEVDLESLEDCKDCLEVEKNELELKVNDLDSQIENVEEFHQIKTEIEQKQKDLINDKNDFDRTKNKQNLSIKNLFQSKVVDEKFKENVQNLKTTLEKDVRKLKEEIDEKTSSLNLIKSELNHSKKQLQIKRDESQNIKMKIEELCGNRDYLDSLNAAKENVVKLNMELAHVKTAEYSLNENISYITENSCCPTCHKNLKSSEKDDLNEEIHDKIRQLPEKINMAMRKLKKEDEKFNKLNNLKSSYDSIEKLEKEIKSLQDQIENHQKTESKLSDQIEDLEMNISEPNSKLNIISTSFLFDMSKLDDSLKRIKQKTNEIEFLKSKLPADMSDKSLDDMRNEKKKFTVEMKKKGDEINQLYKKIKEFRTKIDQYQKKLNVMITEKANLHEKLAGLDRMRNQIKEFDKTKIEIEAQIEENNSKLSPVQEKLDKLINEIDSFKKAEQTKHSKMIQNITTIDTKYQEISRLHQQIKQLENLNLTEKIQKLESEIKSQEKSVTKLKSEKVQKEQRIVSIQEDLSNQEGTRRNLEDNLELLQCKNQKKEVEEKLEISHKTHGTLDATKLINEINKTQSDFQKSRTAEAKLEGRKQELDNNIASKQEELEDPRYKFAHKNYLNECYNVTYLEASLSDLKVYRTVLEKAIIKFHQDKMDQINQSIREYWNSIYRGNDIDYIMIKTSEEDDDKTINKDEKKRSYNYRVVQAKNGGVEIDMRGRCSAGQKVLASLIIRMALADTFSINCGILALDEPTTNLDSNNIAALCNALIQIVQEREKISNKFMLIVITHDMDFIKNLERAEYYYKVSRDNRGSSMIERFDNI